MHRLLALVLFVWSLASSCASDDPEAQFAGELKFLTDLSAKCGKSTFKLSAVSGLHVSSVLLRRLDEWMAKDVEERLERQEKERLEDEEKAKAGKPADQAEDDEPRRKPLKVLTREQAKKDAEKKGNRCLALRILDVGGRQMKRHFIDATPFIGAETRALYHSTHFGILSLLEADKKVEEFFGDAMRELYSLMPTVEFSHSDGNVRVNVYADYDLSYFAEKVEDLTEYDFRPEHRGRKFVDDFDQKISISGSVYTHISQKIRSVGDISVTDIIRNLSILSCFNQLNLEFDNEKWTLFYRGFLADFLTHKGIKKVNNCLFAFMLGADKPLKERLGKELKASFSPNSGNIRVILRSDYEADQKKALEKQMIALMANVYKVTGTTENDWNGKKVTAEQFARLDLDKVLGGLVEVDDGIRMEWEVLREEEKRTSEKAVGRQATTSRRRSQRQHQDTAAAQPVSLSSRHFLVYRIVELFFNHPAVTAHSIYSLRRYLTQVGQQMMEGNNYYKQVRVRPIEVKVPDELGQLNRKTAGKFIARLRINYD